MQSIALRLSSASSSRAARLALCASRNHTRSTPSRHIHVRRPLPYKIEDGMGDFLSPAALKMIAEDYQQGLLDRLNEQLRDTPEENQPIAQVVVSTATERSRALTFNYASLALNNSFFLHHLKAPPEGKNNNKDSIDPHLHYAINHQMGNIEQVESTVSAAVLAMASTGWVWFVTDATGQLGVIATYGAGTLLANQRRQDIGELGGTYIPKEQPPADRERDVPGDVSPSASLSGAPPTSPASGIARQAPPMHPHTPSRALHTTALRANAGPATPASIFASQNRSAGAEELFNSATEVLETDVVKLGAVLYPLFVVSVQEHAWVGAGYGVWGKEEYLKRFWTCLDWKAVSEGYAKYVPKPHV